ncbi:MAG: hypothetical protein ABSB70_08570 [Candidatus Velthaea sp.]|jgi:hypothetical protein
MDLDLRVPIGLFFIFVGLIMAIFGLTSDPAIYQKSLGINVNLDWGIVELVFGALMFVFGRRHKKTAAPVPVPVPAAVLPNLRPVVILAPEPKTEPPVAHG